MTSGQQKESFDKIVPLPNETEQITEDSEEFHNPQREFDHALTELAGSTLDAEFPNMTVGRDENGEETEDFVNSAAHEHHLVYGVPESPLPSGSLRNKVHPSVEDDGESTSSIATPHKEPVSEQDDNDPAKAAAPPANPSAMTFPPPPENHIFFRIFFFLYWTFEWMTIPILKGIFSHPKLSDVPQLPTKMRAQNVNKRFASYWEKFKNLPRPLLLCVLRLIWWEYSLAGLSNLIMRSLDLVVPLMLAQLLKSLKEENSSEIWKGYLWAVAIAVTKLIWSVFMQYHLHYAVRCGMRVRSGLIGLLYEKSMRMARKQDEVMTLVTIDAMKVDLSMQHFHFSWSSVFQIIVSIIFLSFLVGWSTCAGLLVILAVIPVQFIVGKISTRFQKAALKWTDARVKIINEIVGGIQLMKFYAWELSYSDRVKSTRAKELNEIVKVTLTKAVNSATMSIVPVLVSCATFSMYSLMGGKMDIDIIFPAISYFEIMRVPLSYFPLIVNAVVNANVSLMRMEKYMKETEVDSFTAPASETPEGEEKPAVRAVDATYEWPQFEEPPPKKSRNIFKRKRQTQNESESDSQHQEIVRIEDLTFEVKEGELVLIVGAVGSGKTSLLSAILGEMQRVEGFIESRGIVSYVPQVAFLRNATLRQNVLFSLPFEPKRYQEALHFSGLDEDLNQLNGDLTEIGSRGVNLSGGQKTRVCIARSLFSNGSIYLFDDCLSALDASVGKFIFEETIKKYLKDKTRIMVTHQLHFCEQADRILVMDGGRIVEQGSYEDLMRYESGVLRQLIEEHVLVDMEDSAEELNDLVADIEDVLPAEVEAVEEKKPEEKNAAGGSAIIQAEERKTGRISPKVVWAYFRAMGGILAALWLLALFLIAQVFLQAPDLWLTFWSDGTITSLKDNNTANLLIYASMGVAAGFVIIFRDVNFFLFCLHASEILHEKAFERILRAPMSFFEAQPMARILSRFSGDVDITDHELIQNLSMASVFFFQTVAMCIIIAASTSGIFLPPLVIISAIFLIISDIYTRSSREFKRLDSITRSPMLSFFSESINGLTTIRAFNLQEQFKQEQLKKLNVNLQAYYMLQSCSRWLSVRLDVMGAILIFLISICALLIRNLGVITPSLLALGITYSLQFNRVMSWFVRNASLAEVNINAVERLNHYASKAVPNEAALRSDKKLPRKWPTKGVIEFEHTHFRYRPELEDTLKDINLRIEGGQHVAIVGRTGSGKSSSILALFRERELSAGKILIDGVDISTIGLHDLREQLVIVPQVPVCFSGTVKSNLDPFGVHSDEALWDALEKAYLKAHIEKLGGLNAAIDEGGENLSIGERALLVLARALLRKGKILISDEASASIDLSLEQKILDVIETHFASYTTITIAHRIQTIIDSDVIVVLSAGEIVEKGSPQELLKNPDSIFFGLVRDTGETNQRKLMHTALGDEFDKYYTQFQREKRL